MRRLVAGLILSAAAGMASSQSPAPSAPSMKYGFVDTQRIMRQARAAIEVQKTIDAEFERRNKEIAAGPPAEVERRQRALAEDMNAKREDALRQVVDRANGLIKRIAEQDNLDLVFFEAVYASPRVDLTDRVIKALDAQK